MSIRRWLLPVTSLVAVLAVTAWEFASSRTGPGPLHPAHHELDSIFGSDCSSCHKAGAGVDPEGCVRCHEPIGAQRTARSGLHGSLPKNQFDDCAQCHSEHHGSSSALIAPQAFAYAGVHDPAAYDHRHVAEYRLSGAHAVLDCDRCHPSADSPTPPHGGRFLGQQQACASCHEDVHRGVFGSDCEKCHGQVEKFRSAPGFEHSIFPLIDSHARVACEKCHEPSTERSTEALSKNPLPARKCADCHEDPHHPTTAGPAKAILLGDTADCARCHASTKFKDARVTPEKHAEFGFPLRGGHAKAECNKCHGDASNPSKHGDELPPLAACARCHEHPHRAPFVDAAVAAIGPADGCAKCHVDEHASFHVATTTVEQHAASGFPLVEPHTKVECSKCHGEATATGSKPFAERFPGREPDNCRACHEDVHKGQFDHDKRYAQCTACHQPLAFAPNAFGAAMHQKTAFPLTGAHDAVACARCHDDVKDEVRQFHGTSQQCAECHEDVHKGEFDKDGKPKAIAGRTGCARCHDTVAFAPIKASTFDHGVWTGYRIAGAHLRIDCEKCHVPGTNASATAADVVHRRLGKAAGKNCVDCHRDPHQGQFGTGKAADCARCHATEDFRRPHFDHDRDSRFPLDAQHAPLACESCHKTYESAAGPVVRYKPLGSECGDCHKLGNKNQGGR